MRALTVEPGTPRSLQVEDVPDLEPATGELLVRGLAIGVCGTDQEIVRGEYGWSPATGARLVLGHESLGASSRRLPAALSVSVTSSWASYAVRTPSPASACAVGEWDMCRNGRYTERGIKELPGFGSEWWTVPEHYAVQVDDGLGLSGVLTEPTSVVAKAWEQVDRVGGRAWFEPHTVLVTGAGPIGLLAAMIGVQRGLDVHVLDRVATGVKPDLVRDLGATYHRSTVPEIAAVSRPDVVVEATGAGRLVFDAIAETESYGIVCLTGVSPRGRELTVDAGDLNRSLVLENDAVIGSVNANLHHSQAAAAALAAADGDWLRRLVTTGVALEDAASAFDRPDGDVKVVLALEDSVV